jgi:predicted ATPase
MVLELAAEQPLLCIVEDLHWTNPSTLEWLTLLIKQVPTGASAYC